MMAIRTLVPGDSHAGLLIDGDPATPYVGATLEMDNRGVRVLVPYVMGDEQFASVDHWFRDQSPPRNMLLRVPNGAVTLIDNRWHGHSVRSGVSVGTVAPKVAVLSERHGDLSTPLTLREVRSNADGLREWARQTVITSDDRQNEDGSGRTVMFELHQPEPIIWRSGDAEIRIESVWHTTHETQGTESGYDLRESTTLVTRFDDPRPVEDHIAEQRKVLSLVTILMGKGMYFRRHRIKDEQFPVLSIAGTILGYEQVEVLIAATVRDYARQQPTRTDFHDCIAHLTQLGVAHLETWATRYETWSRCILPAVAAFSRTDAYVEDSILSAAMSLEAGGGLIGMRPGEEATYSANNRPTTATNFFRCFDAIGVDWGDRVFDVVALSRAVASVYNDIKHADRGEFPDYPIARVTADVMKLAARLLLANLVDPAGDLLRDHRAAGGVRNIAGEMQAYDLLVDRRGRFIAS